MEEDLSHVKTKDSGIKWVLLALVLAVVGTIHQECILESLITRHGYTLLSYNLDRQNNLFIKTKKKVITR